MISYVVAGDYSGWQIKQAANGLVLYSGFKKAIINKETIYSFDVVTDEHQKSATSGAVKGLVGGALLGGVGALAGVVSGKQVGIYHLEIQFKDGKRSLIKIDDTLYKRLISAMF